MNEVEKAPRELRRELTKRRKEELAQSQHAQVTAAAAGHSTREQPFSFLP
jgi:hypothetical protein